MIGEPIAIRITRNVGRAGPDLIGRFEGAQTSFVADAQQGWNCLHHSIRSQFPAPGFVGTAITARGGPGDLLAAMAMLDVVQPGDVLVIATGGDESGAVVGDNWAEMARNKGAVAVVTDGLVRDLAGIEAVGLPTFSRGTCPNSGHQNGPGEINGVVSVGGVNVSPGDIIVGDRDGVVVVPLAQAAQVATSLEDVVAKEEELGRRIKSGETTSFWDPNRFAHRGVQFRD